MTELLVASLACAAWLYLLLLRGGFWRAAERDDVADRADFMPAAWPRVVAVVPARNEAEVIATSVGSLISGLFLSLPSGFTENHLSSRSGFSCSGLSRIACSRSRFW